MARKSQTSTIRRSAAQYKSRRGTLTVGSDVKRFPKFLVIDRAKTLKTIYPSQSKKITTAQNRMLKATTSKKQNKIYGNLIMSLKKKR